ncbi:MAG: sigma-54-dependent Fis family transcriptional regulator [Myxococcales bacterium]|nr:sigma-54-dependent Fis family transcriptional regulator [Myxococcales bacterium]
MTALGALIQQLVEASDFEAAARATLVAMLATAEDPLSRPALADKGRLLRGVLHLRPDDSYQRLFGVKHPHGEHVEGTGYLTSANVWRWVSEHQTAVSINVKTGTLRTWLADGANEPEKLRAATDAPGSETRERMIQREATHVHVVPIRFPAGGNIIGMVSLEAHLRGPLDGDAIWRECRASLDMMASAAAPYLRSLPSSRKQPPPVDSLAPVVGASTASMMRILAVFSRQDETILLSGPTGVGKSRVARWCHAQSPRRGQPFETVRLLSVPEELQMAELMGWRRGAFTGAVRDTPGALKRAERGTLFIDEIDKLSLKAQAGLLQVLEERRYRPLGDNASERRADVRFIVSTNVDLHAAVRAGDFREDLYYRINVLPVRLAPLEERLEELPQWAEYMFLRRHEESGSTERPRIMDEAMALLLRTSWPGNLRQLDNIVRRAYAIMIADPGDAASPFTLSRRHIEHALGYELRPDALGLVGTMWRAARIFVDEAERREQAGTRLPLDLADVFRGLVLCAAVERRQSLDAAFVLLDQASLLRSRNHHRVLRRELERVRSLIEVSSGDIDAALATILDKYDSTED